MKIYTDISHYLPDKRAELFPVLKPYIGKSKDFTDELCMLQYGFTPDRYTLVSNLEAADLCILPMSWNYYVNSNKVALAKTFVEAAEAAHKKVVSFTSGDYGVKVPYYQHLIVYRQSGYRSRLPETHLGIPVFITDPLRKHFKRETPVLRPYEKKPVVGFCGQTNTSIANAFKEIGRVLWRNIRFYLGRVPHEPQQLLSSSYLRGEVLEQVRKAAGLCANFIERKKYRAGASDATAREKTTEEFYQNIVDSDYIICVRGGGNFSVRFYETLAMGRIPIFINTDCLLPMANEIDWKQHVVWVESHQIKNLEQLVKNFHEAHTSESFQQLQRVNRKLWEEKLRLAHLIPTKTEEI
ncbi:exostosin family protein [Flavobacteriaceae bacterium M23B6Z8]